MPLQPFENLPFDDLFVRSLPGDPSKTPGSRQVHGAAWSDAPPTPVRSPRLLAWSEEAGALLGASPPTDPAGPVALALGGNLILPGMRPIACPYGGHQFGHWAGQLGDGRAITLGETVADSGRWEIQLKGAGPTPYSRSADGRAVLRSSLREFVCSEAMFHLGVPTTRALALVATGEPVIRDMFYDGRPRPEPGAVVTRLAPTFVRFGNFELLASRGDRALLQQLVDFVVRNHYPELATSGPTAGPPLLAWFTEIARRTAIMAAHWMRVGFIHGVMNTDNTSIAGETIDYGPCAFMEAYDPEAVFSSIDHQGRYAYRNQPPIARWNLTRFAETLLPLMVDADDEAGLKDAIAQASAVLDAFHGQHAAALLRGQRAKLGLTHATAADDEGDTALIDTWLAQLHAQSVDFTLAWRHLADAAQGNETTLRPLFADQAALSAWLTQWQTRCAQDDATGGLGPQARAQAMRQVNPWVIPRNHRVEEALAAATEHQDLGPFERLLAALQRPYDVLPEHARYAEPAAAEITARYQTFCGT